MRLSRQAQLLLLWRIRVEAMLVKPVSQNLNRLFGKVSTSAAFGRRPASPAAGGQVERITVVFTRVTVRHGRKLSVSVLILIKSWEDEGNRTLLVSKKNWFSAGHKKFTMPLNNTFVYMQSMHIFYMHCRWSFEFDNAQYKREQCIHFTGTITKSFFGLTAKWTPWFLRNRESGLI